MRCGDFEVEGKIAGLSRKGGGCGADHRALDRCATQSKRISLVAIMQMKYITCYI